MSRIERAYGDGVYAEQPDGTLLFHPLPAPSDEDIAPLARAVCRKACAVSELKGSGLAPDLEFPLRPDVVGRLVVPIASADIGEEAYESYVAALLKSDLGLMADHRDLNDLVLISKIQECGLPIATILEKAGGERDRVVERLVASRSLRDRVDAHSRAGSSVASADAANAVKHLHLSQRHMWLHTRSLFGRRRRRGRRDKRGFD